MKITILGSGTFIPELKRSCPGHLIELDNDQILFDFGRGVIRNLMRKKINPIEIDTVFITHMHADHFSELIPFIALILDHYDKKNLREVYTFYGPKGFKKELMGIVKVIGLDKHKNIKRIKVIDVKPNEVLKVKKVSIKSFKVDHSKSKLCLAYRIKLNKKVFCYSGDSSYCENLKKACKNVDLAIVEATGPKRWNIQSHLNGEDLGILAKECNVKKLVVVHVSKSYLKQVKKDIRKNYKGKVILAKDLMRFKI